MDSAKREHSSRGGLTKRDRAGLQYIINADAPTVVVVVRPFGDSIGNRQPDTILI